MGTDHKFTIGIPLNVANLDDIGMPWEEIKWEDFEITSADYALLFDLFTEFNSAFDIIIDEYEEEVIPADKISDAISLTECYKKKFSDEHVHAADKLLSALNRAKELNKPVELSF